MNLGFCLFNYFPFGGLQRDMLKIAAACHAKGHTIHVFTMSWQGDRPAWLHVHIIPVTGWQNHSRAKSFASRLTAFFQREKIDKVIGFNKLPQLDFYYAADICYAARHAHKPWWYRLLPRYRTWLQLEAATFGTAAHADVLLIAANQQAAYQKIYATPEQRFHVLPPGIAADRRAPANAADLRAAMRAQHGISADEHILLMVASAFKTKGLDRTLTALANLPPHLKQRTQLWVIGNGDENTYRQLADKLGIAPQTHFFGGQEQLRDFYLAADLLVHPARVENTGTVLLEAIVAGLPVLTVATCGYAPYVIAANAGWVLAEPFHQSALNQQLISALQADLTPFKHAALQFADSHDLYSMPERAAAIICGTEA